MKDYSEIENRLQKHYDCLLDAVKTPDTTKKPNNKKSSKWENIKDFFNSTGMQVAAAALALVCTVGGVYLFIFIFSGKNINLNPTTHETSTDTEVSADDPAAKTLQIVFSDMYGRESAEYGVCAGDSVSMRIDLKSVSDLASLSLTLSWDERLRLDYAEYETGFRLDGMHISAGDIELWNTENSCTLEWTASGNKNPKNGACMFVDLVFATPEYAASRFDITVTANTDKILDSKGQKIPVSTKNIIIETTERLLSEFVSSDEISDTEVPVTTEEATTEEDTTEPYDEWYATSTPGPETIPPDVFMTYEITTEEPKTDPQDDTEETEEIPAAETDPQDDTEETEEVPITETDKQDGKDIPEPLKIVLTSFDNREYSSYVGKLAGEAEYFKVFLKNVSNLSAISVTVSWDERLELFTAYNALRPDWYADDSVYELCRRNHSYTFEWSSDDPADAISGDLYFICISFSTPENVASSFNINFTVNTSGTYNTAGQNIPSSSKSIPIETVYKELEWPESVPETDPVTETDTVTKSAAEDPETLQIVIADYEDREYSDRVSQYAGDNIHFNIYLKNTSDLNSVSVTVSWDERLGTICYYYVSGIKHWRFSDADKELWKKDHSYTFEWEAGDPATIDYDAEYLSNGLLFISFGFNTPKDTETEYNFDFTVNASESGQNITSFSKNIAVKTVYKELEWTESVPETGPVAEPVQDDISNYLHYEIIDPSEDESGLTKAQFGEGKFAMLYDIDECRFDNTVIIPDTYMGYPVKMINENAGQHLFSKIKGLKYLNMPDTVVWMNIGLFIGCDDLIEVKLPKNLKEIPQSTFWCCSDLKTVIMPEGLEIIDNEAFYECKSLMLDSFPSSLKVIGSKAFEHCTKLTKLDLNDGLEHIGNEAFSGCSNVREIVIPDSVTSYGSECFANTSVNQITVPAYNDYYEPLGMTSAGNRMFLYCSVLKDVTLEEGTKVIGYEMFKHCVNLKTLTLPQSIEKIGAYAFSESAIESLYIGKNVSEIDEKAFDGFSGTVTIDPENKYYEYKDGMIINK